MVVQYLEEVPKCLTSLDNSSTSWESKKPKAWFRGLPTGKIKNGKKDIGRLKLVKDSLKRPDLVDASFSGLLSGEDWVADEVPESKF
jgi:hypothetical protein